MHCFGVMNELRSNSADNGFYSIPFVVVTNRKLFETFQWPGEWAHATRECSEGFLETGIEQAYCLSIPDTTRWASVLG